jgi:DNA excision repair protein ERCC-8
MDLDPAEHTYLLTSGADATVAVYDITPSLEARRNSTQPLFVLSKRNKDRDTHRFGVSSVQWYPLHSGMFFTASYDGTLKVWDTNSLQALQTFGLKQWCVVAAPGWGGPIV